MASSGEVSYGLEGQGQFWQEWYGWVLLGKSWQVVVWQEWLGSVGQVKARYVQVRYGMARNFI